MKRHEAERDLEFVGFIIFENKLKPSTSAVLQELELAGIRKVMCTGDNILTAISVARECQLIDRTAHCFVPRFTLGNGVWIPTTGCAHSITGNSQDPNAQLSWESIDNNMYRLDEQTLTVSLPIPLDDQSRYAF
jgi:cation-transporting ATPase 13A2